MKLYDCHQKSLHPIELSYTCTILSNEGFIPCTNHQAFLFTNPCHAPFFLLAQHPSLFFKQSLPELIYSFLELTQWVTSHTFLLVCPCTYPIVLHYFHMAKLENSFIRPFFMSSHHAQLPIFQHILITSTPPFLHSLYSPYKTTSYFHLHLDSSF